MPAPFTRRMFAAAALVVAAVPAQADSSKPAALATIGMIGDVAANVAGDCVEVSTLMGPGVDPHLYEARASDVKKLQGADVILYAGYALEGQLGDVLERLGRQKPTVAVSPSSIETAELITVQDVYGIDPHVWMDASLWSQIAPTIADTFAEVAPDCEREMRDRAAAYQSQLESLDGWIEESVASIPSGQRVLVTAHDAFAYYGRAYDIEVEGVQGISTESEAGIADIREMAKIISERKVPAVFIESTINPRTVEAVIEAAGERGHEVRRGGELFSDAMGDQGTPEGTYIGMLRANTNTLVEALGGEPAPWPDALKPWSRRWQGGDSDDS